MRFILIALFFCCSFSLAAQEPAPKIVSGAVLLEASKPFNSNAFMAAIKKEWKVAADSLTVSGKTIIFSVPGATVMIAFLDYPVAKDELQAAIQICWRWPNSAAELQKHQAQAVVSVVGNEGQTLNLYKIFTKTAACLLEQHGGIGLFMNTQYVLSSRGSFLASARNMLQNDVLPLYCWIYFGMIEEAGKGSAYTFGMEEFGFKDLEIYQADQAAGEVHNLLYAVVQAVLKYHQTLHEGQAIVTEEGHKIQVKAAKGALLEGKDVWLVTF